MKSFFKSVLATIVGIVLSTFILFIVGLFIMSAALRSQEKTVEIKSNSILYLDLNRPIIDRQPASSLSLARFSRDFRIGLNELLSNIEKAKTDDKIKGIYIEAKAIDAGYATVDEIREALKDFRTSGKFVVYYSDFLTQKAYYLATAADEIFFNPAGIIMLNGLRIKTNHYKNTLNKLGIEPVVVKAGNYKGATESIERTNMSEPNREQLSRLVESIWESLGQEISESRNIQLADLNSAINKLELKSGEDLKQLNLVDSLVYKGDVINYLKELTSTPMNSDISSVELSAYSKVVQKKTTHFGAPKIAIIYATGIIIDGEADDENIGGEKIARTIRKARGDSLIKAIVLRVNSPGGSALASEVILNEIQRTKGVKPIVVSMGDMAASGGYYISCDADSIIAGLNTITGSIGVFFRAGYSEKLFNKLGITFDIVKTHQHADMYSITRPYTEEEIAYQKYNIESTYDLFLKHVSKGRDISYREADKIAQGRVWSGKDAKEVGLVDSYGGFNDAISAAKKLAGLEENFRIVELPRQETTLEKLMKDLSVEAKVNSSLEELGFDRKDINEIKYLLQCNGILTALPYSFHLE
ncbi:MAG: signal peptide peptidase SppA [Bacteroidales bacterium]|nr:signal peptide peptidase SppA [Bacteroidales bacterium]MBN2820636.1 signal peptide peptidase SppA [Bacteroidales bacterium]